MTGYITADKALRKAMTNLKTAWIDIHNHGVMDERLFALDEQIANVIADLACALSDLHKVQGNP